MNLHSPAMFLRNRENLKVESAGTELPLTGVAIGAFEVDAARFPVRVDIPAATTLVGNQRKTIVFGYIFHKASISVNRS